MSEHGLPGKEVKRVQQRLDFQRFSGKRRLNGDLLLLLSRPTASAPGLETAQGQKGKALRRGRRQRPEGSSPSSSPPGRPARLPVSEESPEHPPGLRNCHHLACLDVKCFSCFYVSGFVSDVMSWVWVCTQFRCVVYGCTKQ